MGKGHPQLEGNGHVTDIRVPGPTRPLAPALLTRDDSNNDKIAAAKQTFAELVDKSQAAAGP